MDRDQALKIADRIMDRVEQDRALHRDAIADEVVAGFAARLDGVPKPYEVPSGLISTKYAAWREWSSADLIAAGWYSGIDSMWRPLP